MANWRGGRITDVWTHEPLGPFPSHCDWWDLAIYDAARILTPCPETR
jgi:hypothetical protein